MQAKSVIVYMRQALALALKARGRTFPNPLVGALVVKEGKVIGRGFHKEAGGPHAEIFALRQAGLRAKGASLVCTFEPCAHVGRTGPCVREIVRAGVKDVYIGMIDPNPLTRGKGASILRRAGIAVHMGFLKEKIAAVNRPFIKAMTEGMPFVTAKIAQSLDGKIATKTGASKWITSSRARAVAHDARRFFDAIMVGIHTVLKDDPGLEPLPSAKGHRLVKVIVDSELRTPVSAKLFKTRQPVVIAAVKKNKKREEALRKKGARIIYTVSKRGRVDLRRLLELLNALEVRSILVEGGAELIGSFLDERLADRLMAYIAPKVIGGTDALGSVGGQGVSHLDRAIGLENISVEKIGCDLLIEGDIAYHVHRTH